MFFLYQCFHFSTFEFNFTTLLYFMQFEKFICYFNLNFIFMIALVITIKFLIFMNWSIHLACLMHLITFIIKFIEYSKIYFMQLLIYYCISLIFHFKILTADLLEIIMVLFFKHQEVLSYSNFVKHLKVLKSFYLVFIILQEILIYFKIKELFINFVGFIIDFFVFDFNSIFINFRLLNFNLQNFLAHLSYFLILW